MTTNAKWVASLAFEARQAVVSHRRDYAQNPDRHRGCLWCEDGRLSHWATDSFYRSDPEVVDKALALYGRAYPRTGELACEAAVDECPHLPGSR